MASPGLASPPPEAQPEPPSAATIAAGGPVQHLDLGDATPVAEVRRDGFTSDSNPKVIAARASTNADWARLVLAYGGWPRSASNVNAILQWMDSENPPERWWNRNNPLNNGYGSGGGAGFGSYLDLTLAAKFAAENLHRHPGYAAIIAGLAVSAPTAQTAAAIIASPWASGHYAGGAHWHAVQVPIVAAPAGRW